MRALTGMRSWILGVARSGVVLGLAIGTCSVAWGGGSYEMLVNPSFDQLLSGSTTDPMGWISNEGFVPAVGGCCSDQGDSKPGVSNGNLNFGNSSTVVVSQEVSLSAVVPQTSEFYLSYGVQKNQQDGQYWVLAEFLDASGSSVATLRYPASGTAVAPSSATVQSLSLGRSASARFGEINKVRVSLFGKQTSYIWYGHYGPAFSSVSLVASQVPPVGVTGLVATGGNASVTLSWAAPPTTSTVPSDYVIDYSADGGTTWLTFQDQVSTATSATVTGLANGALYQFRVSAMNAMGTSVPSVVATAKPSAPPQLSSQVWKELYATTSPIRNGSAIVYALDDSQTLAGFSIQQVRYRMEAKVNNTLQYVNATFDAWSGLTVGELRFPAVTVTPIQRNVSNLSVESTVSGVSTGSGMTGRLEIWPNDYSPTAVAPASTSGSGEVYDLDDTMSSGGAYGSFQVHNLTSRQTVFAWNSHGNANPDIGFGNNPYSQNTDWTFYGSNYGLDRSSWRLSVFIGIDGIPDSWTVTEDVASNLTFYGTPLSDAENDTLTATLSVPDGTLSAAAPASSGVTVSSSTTASGSSVILTGKAADLNAYLTTSGSLKYQPPQNATQSRTATLSVSDGTLSVSKNVTLQITAVNDAPSLAAISVNGTEDTTLTFTAANFTGAYSDPESPVLSSITVVTPPATGVLKLSVTAVTAGQIIPAATLANLTYVPAAHENGAKTFTVTASDGDLSSSVSTVTMNLVAVNDAPVANTQSVTVTEDVAKVITLTGTDVEGSALTYTIASQPTKGVLSGTAPNLTYTPTPMQTAQTCSHSRCGTVLWILKQRR